MATCLAPWCITQRVLRTVCFEARVPSHNDNMTLKKAENIRRCWKLRDASICLFIASGPGPSCQFSFNYVKETWVPLGSLFCADVVGKINLICYCKDTHCVEPFFGAWKEKSGCRLSALEKVDRISLSSFLFQIGLTDTSSSDNPSVSFESFDYRQTLPSPHPPWLLH